MLNTGDKRILLMSVGNRAELEALKILGTSASLLKSMNSMDTLGGWLL